MNRLETKVAALADGPALIDELRLRVEALRRELADAVALLADVEQKHRVSALAARKAARPRHLLPADYQGPRANTVPASVLTWPPPLRRAPEGGRA